jgi:hypothetical protein
MLPSIAQTQHCYHAMCIAKKTSLQLLYIRFVVAV